MTRGLEVACSNTAVEAVLALEQDTTLIAQKWLNPEKHPNLIEILLTGM